MTVARSAIVALATALGAAAAVAAPSPMAPAAAMPGAPAVPDTPAATASPGALAALSSARFTRSYYMGDTGFAAARNLGCANGDKTGRMNLFFGAPTSVSGTYGATLWGAADRTAGQVAAIVKEFARGYAFCRRSPSYSLLIGVGTSNSSINRRSEVWLEAHGRRWASMVRSLRAWADTYHRGYFSVYGAWNAEPWWSTPNKAEHWMHGYNSVPGRVGMQVVNSADGCSTTSSTNTSCDNGWSQYWLWRLSWWYDPALPMPQLYTTSGSMARQWHQIDRYGVRRGDGLYFYGVTAQHAACRQLGLLCAGIDATAREAHDYLLWYSNSDPSTYQQEILSPTDIRWHS
jgi:hypothetical protein